MPLLPRRQKQAPMMHSNIEVVGLSRVETVSSIPSDATTDNQPGAGRTVGLFFTYLGSELEDAMNKRAERLNFGSSTPTAQLARIDSISSIDSDATIDDQPGAGRTVGLFFSWFGTKIEKALNKRAERYGLGPKAIADEIICRLGYSDMVFGIRHKLVSCRTLSKSEMNSLRKLCKKMINYARSRVIDTQLIALEEITKLAIEDPEIRAVLASCNLNRLITHYAEPDLLTATTKALGAIEFSNVHRVWAPVASMSNTLWRDSSDIHVLLEGLKEAVYETIRNPPTSFLSARYFERAVREFGSSPRLIHEPLKDFLRGFKDHYTRVASLNPGCIEWSTFESCTHFPPGGQMYIQERDIVDLASTLDPHVFIRHLSFFLVRFFPGSPNYSPYNNNTHSPRIFEPGADLTGLYTFLSSLQDPLIIAHIFLA
ncbi:hypothetical protein SCHPADRAFT_525752 [Schizopora paradoxa]|uniref:Uncharacterized protein n=1 Tax=Schizopora paradoxa TaxID=27342 RepID=A0A0H2RFD9_9AGAM|nr:hypothetical protein SCHPADRAFT_525752 [Schizopora paradoxa]